MGLVMVGTGAPGVLGDMMEVHQHCSPPPHTQSCSDPTPPHPPQYARETQHEKIQRGLALGIAMVRVDRKCGCHGEGGQEVWLPW